MQLLASPSSLTNLSFCKYNKLLKIIILVICVDNLTVWSSMDVSLSLKLSTTHSGFNEFKSNEFRALNGNTRLSFEVLLLILNETFYNIDTKNIQFIII